MVGFVSAGSLGEDLAFHAALCNAGPLRKTLNAVMLRAQTPLGSNIVRKNTSQIFRAIGTKHIRNTLALIPLQWLRTDGTLSVYYLFFYQYFTPDSAIKMI